MKKIIIAFAALSLVLGCTKGIEQKSGQTVERVFTASFDEQSKTSLDASGKVDWCKDDAILYYTASEGAINSVTALENSHSFTFTATVGLDDSFIVAAYCGTISEPQGKSMTLTSNAAGAEQSGKFEDAHVSVCKRLFKNGTSLSFKSVTSLIKFSLTRSDISYVTFTADDGTKIHGNGKIYFTFSSETISSSFGQEDGGSTIKINTDGAGTFFIASLPCSINGFTLKYFDSSDKLIGSTTSTKTLSIGSKKIVDLGTMDSRIEDVPPVDLSANGTANCYIASELGANYKFKATVKGGSSESVGTIEKAKVLWESFGTDVTPNVGDVVSNVSMDGDYVKFTSGQNGNAVIAVVDEDGDILWSWHIWVCEGYDPDASAQVYNNNAGTMMDRNLGATSATPGDVHALGLLYQWGRKDPFLGSSSIYSSIGAKSTLQWPSPVVKDADTGTISYVISHPTTFISTYSYDWQFAQDNTRWKSAIDEKSAYDPCPHGYRVPDGGINGVWSTALGNSLGDKNGPWDDTNKGLNFGLSNGKSSSMQLGLAKDIWYPAAACRITATGGLYPVGRYGIYWSCTPIESQAYRLYFERSLFDPMGSFARSDAHSVRCISDDSNPIIPITDINLNKDSISMVEGNTEQLTASIIPNNANVKTIAWSSSDLTVATVSESGLVTAIAPGLCSVSAQSYNRISKSCTIIVTENAADLSASGAANCYLVSTAGNYKLKAVKGNSSTSIGTMTSACVLWESFGTSASPTIGDLVKDIKIDGEYIIFTASDLKGNAVIAAKNSSGAILWSWHIWLTDKPKEQVYNNNAGTMMDRNLGATSATPGDVHALGLLYQWGRKDPFLCVSAITSGSTAQSTITWPDGVTSNATTGTIAYTVSHPTTFIIWNARNSDWYYTGSSTTDDSRWTSSKSLYDPCPPGYRVPMGGSNGIWRTAFNTSIDDLGNSPSGVYYFNSKKKGMNFGATSLKLGTDTIIWYPTYGDSNNYDGTYWSCTPNSYHAYNFNIHYNSIVNKDNVIPSHYSVRMNKAFVRCQKM